MSNSYLSAVLGGGIKSLQRGITAITPGLAYVDVTIASVNTAKAVEQWNGTYGSAVYVDDVYFGITLLNSTTLRIKRIGTTNTIYVCWVVTEWN